MVADPLALDLAERFVDHGSTVPDPFCGFRAASWLLLKERRCGSVSMRTPRLPPHARAKLVPKRRDIIRSVLADLPRAELVKPEERLTAAVNGKVDWFSPAVLNDLEKVVTWLNDMSLDEDELTVWSRVKRDCVMFLCTPRRLEAPSDR